MMIYILYTIISKRAISRSSYRLIVAIIFNPRAIRLHIYKKKAARINIYVRRRIRVEEEYDLAAGPIRSFNLI